MPTEENSPLCPDCEGLGWVVEEDGGAGTARPCRCRLEQALPRLIEGAGIPPRYQHCTLSSFKTSGATRAEGETLLRAQRFCQRYVDQFLTEEGRFRESGLLFIGPPGGGKTHLAVAVLRELVTRYRVRGIFVDFTSLIHQIQSTFDPRSPESKHDVLDPVTDAELLVLDELAAQKPTPWVTEILYLILNSRYTARRPTLFTTNYRLESEVPEPKLDRPGAVRAEPLLTGRIPAALVSRLYEMALPVHVDVQDFRREVGMARI